MNGWWWLALEKFPADAGKRKFRIAADQNRLVGNLRQFLTWLMGRDDEGCSRFKGSLFAVATFLYPYDGILRSLGEGSRFVKERISIRTNFQDSEILDGLEAFNGKAMVHA